MNFRVLSQSCDWKVRPLVEVPVAGAIDEVAVLGDAAVPILRLSGWALTRAGAPVRLELRGLDAPVFAEFTRPSPDVQALYSEIPGAAHCRFTLEQPLTGIAGPAAEFWLWVHDADGRVSHFGTVVVERTDAPVRAVFVVGSPRSGTTVLGDALRAALGCPGYGEAHALPLVARMIEAVDRYYVEPNVAAAREGDTLIGHLRHEEMRARIALAWRAIYAGLHRGGTFVDKTPGVAMIRAMPIVPLLWPDARIVFARRRGIENVESRRRKFPQSDFASHCRDWVAAMQAWRGVRTQLDQRLWLEVDQYELAYDPDRVSVRLADALALTHDQRKRLREYLRGKAPERTSADWAPLDWDALPWSEDERRIFDEICGEELAVNGYSRDAGYWAMPA